MIAPIAKSNTRPGATQAASASPASQASQAVVERILHDDGVVIDHASDAAEVTRRFASDDYDLIILTDSNQPGAARAVQALRARAAQEGRRHLPVLVMTGASEHDAQLEARDLGADDVLPLTLPAQQVAARVRAYLALSSRAGRNPRQTPSPWRHELTQRLVHDLRNPLAGLSSNLAYVDDRLGDAVDPEVQEALADCRAAVGRLRRAATMMVDLGRLEEGNLLPRKAPTPVAPLLADLFGQRMHEASLRELRLLADVPPGLSGHFDPEIVGRMLHALLDHALRYAQTGSAVQVQAAAREGEPGGLVLRFEAAGEWLPKVERSFLRSGRGAPTFPSVVEVGLGLHYAQLGAVAHGGSLEVQDEPPEAPRKTVVQITL